MKLSHGEREKFYEALLDAFPNYPDLERMVYFKLSRNLREIVADTDLQNVVFQLIKWAERNGRLEDLIRGAHQENSGNPKLRDFCNNYFSRPPQPKILPVEPPQPSEKWLEVLFKKMSRRELFLLLAALGGIGFGAFSFNRESSTPITSATPENTTSSTTETNTSPAPENTTTPTPETATSEQTNSFREDLGNGITLEMMEIPGGDFRRGSPPDEEGRSQHEGPQLQVTVPEFFMGKFEVTQEQYEEVMGKNPSHFKGKKRPVENVSWDNVVEFCEKLSQKTGRTYRLPSEAEWEYACRAGTTTRFYFGENITPDLANYGNKIRETTPIGKFRPNAFGLYDMHGNVWEWCQDTGDDNYNRAPRDGSAWINNDNSSRVLRGCSWSNGLHLCRSASRYKLPPH